RELRALTRGEERLGQALRVRHRPHLLDVHANLRAARDRREEEPARVRQVELEAPLREAPNLWLTARRDDEGDIGRRHAEVACQQMAEVSARDEEVSAQRRGRETGGADLLPGTADGGEPR